MLVLFDCYTVIRDVWFFFFQAEDGIRAPLVTGVPTCALPILAGRPPPRVALARIARIDEGAAVDEEIDLSPRQLDAVLVVVGVAAGAALAVRSGAEAEPALAVAQDRDAGVGQLHAAPAAFGRERLEAAHAIGAEQPGHFHRAAHAGQFQLRVAQRRRPQRRE